MRRPHFLSRLDLSTAAVVGVVIGHTLSYLLAIWGADARHAVLDDTGHGYWGGAVVSAVVLGAWTVGTIAVRHYSRGRDAVGGLPTRMTTVVTGLAWRQTVAFLVLESVERLVAGASLTTMLAGQVVLVGIGVQLVVAFAIALILWALACAAQVLGHFLAARSTFQRIQAAWPVPTEAGPRPVLVPGAWGLRSPPSF